MGPSRARKTALFISLPIVSALASLVALPAVSFRFGAEGWAAVAVGTAVGMSASVLIELGWAVNGPVRAARAQGDSVARLYLLSAATKMLFLVPIAPASALVAFLLSSEFASAAALAAVAGAMLGLSPAWFFIGRGAPGIVLLVDVLPRVLAAGTAAVLVLQGSPLWVYPVTLAAAAALSFVLGGLVAGVSWSAAKEVSRHRVMFALRSQMIALRGQAASALYIALPIVLVSISAPGAVAVFSAAERLQRMALSVLKSIPNSMVGGVAESRSWSERERRTRRTILVNGVLGLTAGVTFAVLAPFAAQVIFAGVVDLPPLLSVLCGAVIALTSVSRAVGGIGLVVYGRVDALSSSAFWGAGVGIPAILVLPVLWGAAGGLVGEILAESAVLARQAPTLFREISRRRTM